MTLDEAQRKNKRPSILKRKAWDKQVSKLTDQSKGGLAPSEMDDKQLAKHQKEMGNLEFIKKGMTGTYGQAENARSDFNKTRKASLESTHATNMAAMTAQYDLGEPSTPAPSVAPSMSGGTGMTIQKKTLGSPGTPMKFGSQNLLGSGPNPLAVKGAMSMIKKKSKII